MGPDSGGENAVWGERARAIEVHPAQGDLVNGGNYRHLWRLGALDFCPDFLVDFHDAPSDCTLRDDMLQNRVVLAWLGEDAVMA